MKSLFAGFIALCLILSGVCVCFPQCGAGNFIPPENAPTDSFVSPNTGLKSWIYDDIEITSTQNGGDIHGTEFVGSQSTTMKPSNYQAPIAFIGYVMPDYIKPAIRLK